MNENVQHRVTCGIKYSRRQKAGVNKIPETEGNQYAGDQTE
jgi:hypothetical protein